MRSFKSATGRMLRELKLQLERAQMPHSEHRLVVFPNENSCEPASNLRVHTIVRELATLGWRVIIVPKQLNIKQRQRIIAQEKPAAILMQQIYHPLNRPYLYEGAPIYFDIDDSVFDFPDLTDEFRRVCESAAGMIVGSKYIADWCRPYNSNVHVVWTCTPDLGPLTAPPASERHAIVGWAHSSPLDFPSEVEMLKDIMSVVINKIDCELWLYGRVSPERVAGFLKPFEQIGIKCRFHSHMEYPAFLNSMQNLAVGLQLLGVEPLAKGRSFGKILAYIQEGVPVVCANDLEHVRFFRHGENGMLADNVDEYAQSICSLLRDRELRDHIAGNAHADFRRRLVTPVGALLVDKILRSHGSV